MSVQIPAALPDPEAPRREALSPPPRRNDPIDKSWLGSEPEAVARARREHRPLILNFTAEWCGASKELEHRTYADPRVEEALRRFVKAKVDATNDEDPLVIAIKDSYRVVGLPTILVLDSTGKERARIVEFIEPEQLITVLAPVQ